jgi:ribulose-phosphate 3-epimerase
MKKCIKVAPSLTAGNLLHIKDEIQKIETSGADCIHIDVMDGHFVPFITLGVPIIEQIRKITKMPLDVHMMIKNPDHTFQDYLHAGANTLSFHQETATHAHRLCCKIKELGSRAGIVLNPATHWQTVEYLLPTLDQITVMSVNPGFSRQKHLSIVHQKIQDLSHHREKNNLKYKIMVDGGVTKDNVQTLMHLGTDIVVVGGAIFDQENYKNAILTLKEAASQKE